MTNNNFENDLTNIEEFIAKIDVVRTPEEQKEIWEKNNQEAMSKGFLSGNPEYTSGMRVSMEVVEKNPRVYIIEECIPACKELWKKNIYTFMVSDHYDEGNCWIEIDLDNLSDENKEIYNNLVGENIIKFSYHSGCVNFGVKEVGASAQQKLLELAQQFEMQDIPYGEGYITLEDYLIKCGCYDEIENPNYIEMEEPWNSSVPIEQLGEYIIKYDEWKNSDKSEKTIRVFNPSKVTRPLNEYFINSNVVYDGERVYMSDYHYKKHLNYINGLKQNKR